MPADCAPDVAIALAWTRATRRRQLARVTHCGSAPTLRCRCVILAMRSRAGRCSPASSRPTPAAARRAARRAPRFRNPARRPRRRRGCRLAPASGTRAALRGALASVAYGLGVPFSLRWTRRCCGRRRRRRRRGPCRFLCPGAAGRARAVQPSNWAPALRHFAPALHSCLRRAPCCLQPLAQLHSRAQESGAAVVRTVPQRRRAKRDAHSKRNVLAYDCSSSCISCPGSIPHINVAPGAGGLARHAWRIIP